MTPRFFPGGTGAMFMHLSKTEYAGVCPRRMFCVPARIKTLLIIGSVMILVSACSSSVPPVGAATDSLEFLNGAKLEGTVTQIRETDKEVDFETAIGDRTFTRTYPFSVVHTVTRNGKRHALSARATASESESTDRPPPDRIRAIIAEAGNSPPAWFAATPLVYPDTLDLSWPLKPPTEGWHSQENMGQYLWSVINENPGRWHSGIKLVHHCVSLHKDAPTLLERDMAKLGTMYFTLLQDYARAAFWYQKAKPSVGRINGVRLAECYWRLGNRDMALDMLRGKPLPVGAIKLLGDMDEIDWAVRLTKAFEKYNSNYQAYILAGDALRQAGMADEAIGYYQQVIDSKKFRNKDYEQRFKARARESIEAIRLYDQVDVSQVADGRYRDSSTGYAGQVEIEVDIARGRMKSVRVTEHREKQFYSALTDTTVQLVAGQSVQGIDATSGATITSQAIVNATARALAKGAK
ncbi:MAG: FMN-binding protein [Fuerstiella sp.]|nr:FMN-binding protein [Fuerstiella sp.]